MSKEAHGRLEGKEGGERAWGRRSSSKSTKSAGGRGGDASSRSSGLGALEWCYQGQTREEEEGVLWRCSEASITALMARIEDGDRRPVLAMDARVIWGRRRRLTGGAVVAVREGREEWAGPVLGCARGGKGRGEMGQGWAGSDGWLSLFLFFYPFPFSDFKNTNCF